MDVTATPAVAEHRSRQDSATHGATSSLRSLGMLMLLCVAVPLLMFSAFAAYRYKQMYGEAEVRLDRALRIAHEHALRVLDTNEMLLRHVLDLVQVDDDRLIVARQEQIHQQLVALAHNKPQVQSIWVQGPDGHPLSTNRFATPPNLDVSDREYFKWHKEKRGGLYVTGPLMGRVTRDSFFDISRGRYRSDGRFAGLVSVSLFPSYFTSFHADLAADEPGLAITMFREDGTVYSRWPALEGAAESMPPASPVLSRVRLGETAGTIRGISPLDGRERLILFRKLGDYPIYLVTERQVAAIRADWLHELGVIATFGLVPVLGVLYAAYLAIRRTREALASAGKLQEESIARRQVEEALLQAQKLEALGRLTGGVAHDFNNALMVISGNLHLLRMTQPQAGTKFTDAIGRAVESATKLTRQLLAFSRRQALVPQTVSLQSRLPALRDLLAPILGNKIDLSIEVDPDTSPIHIDMAELELAAINLAVNAKDAMVDAGSFRLVAANRQWSRPGETVTSWVSIEAVDTGSGMEPEVAARSFEPFFTTKPIGKGTGLGLSQVYALCKRAGGDAVVESAPGKGTTVRMLFPPSLGPADGGGPVVRPQDAPVDKSVLLVEDNEEVAAVVKPVLEKMGCRVVHLDRGEAALEWLASHPGSADVLVTDVVMPGEVDGLALATHVKARYPGLGVLVMTGYAEQLEAISQLGFEVLPKPFSPVMLAEALKRVLKGQRSA